MATNFKIVQTPAVTLYQGISATATSMTVSPYPKDLDGNKLVMGDFGTVGRVTVDPGVSSFEEIIEFNSMTDNGNNTCTLAISGRDVISKFPYNTYGTGKLHGASATVVFSNNPQAYNEFGALRNDNTWSGINTFNISPSVPSPTNTTDAANKSYIDNAVQSGGVDMSTTVKGIGRSSYSPNKTLGTMTVTVASPAVITLNNHGLTVNDTIQITTTGTLPTGLSPSTAYYVISAGLTSNSFEVSQTLGGTAINTSGSQSGTHTLIRTTPYVVNDNDPRVPTTAQVSALAGNNIDVPVGAGNTFVTQTGSQHNAEKYATDVSGSSTAYTTTLSPVPTSLTIGMIVYVKIGLANTTTNPTLNINGLGAKTIVKGVNSVLAIGDISANQLCTFQYDGTNLVLLNPNYPTSVAPASFASTYFTSNAGVTSTQNVDTTYTTNFTPKIITITYFIRGTTGSGSAASMTGIATFDGTTLKSNWFSGSGVWPNVGSSVQTLTTGDGGANDQTAISILSTSSTGFVVRVAFVKGGTWNGQCLANYQIVATA